MRRLQVIRTPPISQHAVFQTTNIEINVLGQHSEESQSNKILFKKKKAQVMKI